MRPKDYVVMSPSVTIVACQMFISDSAIVSGCTDSVCAEITTWLTLFSLQTIHTGRQAGDECGEHEVGRRVRGCRPPVPHLPQVAIWKPRLKLPGVIDYRNIT